jgi:amidophosphoribosyltransferase
MPSRTELVAYGRSTDEIADAIGADLVVFQKLADLEASVRQFNSKIPAFDCSVFTGEYVTGGVNEEYLSHLEALRADNVKGKLIADGLGSAEGKGGGAVQPNGIRPEREMVSLSNGETQVNGADDTVGLHNAWTSRNST